MACLMHMKNSSMTMTTGYTVFISKAGLSAQLQEGIIPRQRQVRFEAFSHS